LSSLRLAVLVTIVSTLQACRVDNPDHCLHKDADPHAWCEAAVPGQPFCSPCEGDDHGCVVEEPSEKACPAYEPPEPGAIEDTTETGAETETEVGTTASDDTSDEDTAPRRTSS
jgi:hypothetical protein